MSEYIKLAFKAAELGHLDLLKLLLGSKPLEFPLTRPLYVELNRLRAEKHFQQSFFEHVLQPFLKKIQSQQSGDSSFNLDDYKSFVELSSNQFAESFKPYADFKSTLPDSKQLLGKLSAGVTRSVYHTVQCLSMKQIIETPTLFINMTEEEVGQLRAHFALEKLDGVKSDIINRMSGIDSHDKLAAFITQYHENYKAELDKKFERIAELEANITEEADEAKRLHLSASQLWWATTTVAERAALGVPEDAVFSDLIGANVPVDIRNEQDQSLFIRTLSGTSNPEVQDYLLTGGMSVGDTNPVGMSITQIRLSPLGYDDSSPLVLRHKQKELAQPLDPDVTHLSNFTPLPQPIPAVPDKKEIFLIRVMKNIINFISDICKKMKLGIYQLVENLSKLFKPKRVFEDPCDPKVAAEYVKKRKEGTLVTSGLPALSVEALLQSNKAEAPIPLNATSTLGFKPPPPPTSSALELLPPT